MWVLVIITLMVHPESLDVRPVVDEFYYYDSMHDCFDDREYMMDTDGFPRQNQQAVCIYYDAT